MFISALCFGWAVASSLQAGGADARLAEFRDGDFLRMAGLELALAGLALLVLRLRRFDVAGLLPRPSWRGAAQGLLLGACGWAAGWAVMQPFAAGAAGEEAALLTAGLSLSPLTIAAVSLVNGTYEEVFLLGFLARGLTHRGTLLALGAPLLVRALFHGYQGPLALAAVLVFGLVLGLWYLRTAALFPAVLAHVLADVVGLAWT